MSSSYNINTAFDNLDDSLVSNVFDLDSWTSSLSPPVTSPEPVRDSTRHPRQKRHVRTRSHPRPTPAFTLPPVSTTAVASPVLSAPAVASTSAQSSVLSKADKGKGRQQATPTTPPASPVDPSV